MKTIWSKIRYDYCDENFICIDAWLTFNHLEEGCTIAKISLLNGTIEYIDKRAENDEYAIEVIQKVLNENF
jgi:hypothetical protein